jgi:DNA-binding MarR family transcriptional regulator
VSEAPLTLPQRRHLMALLTGGPLRGRTSLDVRGELSPSMRSGVATTLDRLVQRGLVELTPGGWNGSTFEYRITAAGRDYARSHLL